MSGPIATHNEKAAATWDMGGANYDAISRGIADSIEHCVLRLDPRPGERILDLATGTGWTSRAVARRGANVIGVDIGHLLIEAASEKARAEGLEIDYKVGDAEALPFENGAFDAVISTCGIMFAGRPEAAAAAISIRVGQDGTSRRTAGVCLRFEGRNGRLVLPRAERRSCLADVFNRVRSNQDIGGQSRRSPTR